MSEGRRRGLNIAHKRVAAKERFTRSFQSAKNKRVNRSIILLCGYVDTQNSLCYTDRTDIYLFFDQAWS